MTNLTLSSGKSNKSLGPNNVGMWLTEQLLASPLSFTERPNFASI